MKRIKIVYREDLLERAKLKHTSLIELGDFGATFGTNDDTIIFFCSLLHEYKVLKNRTGVIPETSNLDSPEDENALLSLLIGY